MSIRIVGNSMLWILSFYCNRGARNQMLTYKGLQGRKFIHNAAKPGDSLISTFLEARCLWYLGDKESVVLGVGTGDQLAKRWGNWCVHYVSLQIQKWFSRMGHHHWLCCFLREPEKHGPPASCRPTSFLSCSPWRCLESFLLTLT